MPILTELPYLVNLHMCRRDTTATETALPGFDLATIALPGFDLASISLSVTQGEECLHEMHVA